MKTKKLYLIRHAKAEDFDFYKRDFDRNIVDEGKERADEIAQILQKEWQQTDHTRVISSSANRARQTATLFCDILGYPTEQIHMEDSIYEAHFKQILTTINQVPDDIDTLLVFGHNPGLSELTNYLCHSFVDLKTSHIAVITLEENIDFSTLSGGTANLIKVITEG